MVFTGPGPSSLSVASYNVLCDAYIKPEYYPHCSADDLSPEKRHPRLVDRVAGLGTDVICLQEVDYAMFERLEKRLRPLGYRGRWAHKGMGKPDGCATFVRSALRVITDSVLLYDDNANGRNPSGHVALLSVISAHDHREVIVVNTHLKYDAPETPPDLRTGQRQAEELVAKLRDGAQGHLVICGDFNAEEGSAVMNVFAAYAYQDAHSCAMLPTCVANGRAQKIDAILCCICTRVEGVSTPAIDGATALPSATEPSDHVPICATFAAADH